MIVCEGNTNSMVARIESTSLDHCCQFLSSCEYGLTHNLLDPNKELEGLQVLDSHRKTTSTPYC